MTHPIKTKNSKAALFASTIAAILAPVTPAIAATIGLAFSQSDKVQSGSVESRFKHFSLVKQLKFGLGVRASVFHSNRALFSTADASEIAKNRIEILDSKTFTVLAANALIFTELDFNSKYGFSVSVDAMGFSWGKETTLTSASQSSSAQPSFFNFLIFDTYDHGTLNSHFLLTRKLDDCSILSAGLAHQFVEYTSREPFEFSNRRFRLKSDAIVLSVTHNLN